MIDDAVLKDYARFDFTDPAGRWTRPVWRRGSGPAVIVIHEMPGLHPLVVRFADRVAAAGMTVFCPSLFGDPGREVSPGYALGEMFMGICVRREFNVWASDRSSPIVDWLRALAAHVHAECGGKGVGAVGMCFTGNFALAMMTEPSMVAPVLSQPSLPLPVGSRRRSGGIGVSEREIACAKRRFQDEDLSMIGLRFIGDPFVPDARFETLKSTFGERFEAIEIAAKDGLPDPRMAAHSVLTLHLDDGDPDGPTKRAEERVIAFSESGPAREASSASLATTDRRHWGAAHDEHALSPFFRQSSRSRSWCRVAPPPSASRPPATCTACWSQSAMTITPPSISMSIVPRWRRSFGPIWWIAPRRPMRRGA